MRTLTVVVAPGFRCLGAAVTNLVPGSAAGCVAIQKSRVIARHDGSDEPRIQTVDCRVAYGPRNDERGTAAMACCEWRSFANGDPKRSSKGLSFEIGRIEKQAQVLWFAEDGNDVSATEPQIVSPDYELTIALYHHHQTGTGQIDFSKFGVHL